VLVTDHNETVVFNIAQIKALPVTALQVAVANKKDLLLSQVFRYTQMGGHVKCTVYFCCTGIAHRIDYQRWLFALGN